MGANIIYDTDDDNYPLETERSFSRGKNLKFIKTSEEFLIFIVFSRMKKYGLEAFL